MYNDFRNIFELFHFVKTCVIFKSKFMKFLNVQSATDSPVKFRWFVVWLATSFVIIVWKLMLSIVHSAESRCFALTLSLVNWPASVFIPVHTII